MSARSSVKNPTPAMAKSAFSKKKDAADAKEQDSPLSSTAMRLREALTNMILTGEIAAGSRLDQRQLAKHLHTTTAPLREALSALETEGLLIRQQGLGVFCRVYTVLEIEEMVEIRGMLESLAARRATARITDEEIEELTVAAHELGTPFLKPEEPEFLRRHVDFHKRIVEISRSPRLKALLDFHHFIDQVLMNAASSLWSVQAHDHTDIVLAIASRDPEKAEMTMRNHIAPTYKKRFEALRKRFGEGPILPTGM